AMLTMWASTNASSVSEWPPRYFTQPVAAGMAATTVTPRTIRRIARRGHRHQERGCATAGTGAGGGGVAGAGGARAVALLMVCLLVWVAASVSAGRSWGGLRWNWREPDCEVQLSQGCQVVVGGVQVVLLGPRERRLGVGHLGGRRVALCGAGLQEPVR